MDSVYKSLADVYAIAVREKRARVNDLEDT